MLKKCNVHGSFSNRINYAYECFDQYCKLASTVTRGATLVSDRFFVVDSARRNSYAQIL